MEETTKQFLNIMFRPGEQICVSHNEYSYHSISLLSAINGPVVLVPTLDSCEKRKRTIEELTERLDPSRPILCALNPIMGYREDANCTAFRNFLVEVDYGPLKEQLAYVRKLGLPYSACVFSGNKSLHFLVSVDEDLPSENAWRIVQEWILNIITLADSKTKNPSRMIRIPGSWRTPSQKQRLVEIKGQTKLTDLTNWLKQYPQCKPQVYEKRQVLGERSVHGVKQWALDKLKYGIDTSKGRNQQWFSIACEFALAGYSEDDTIDILSDYFSPDRDFKRKEWLTSVRSGFKHIGSKR